MLMTLPLTCGPRIQFSCKSCNVTMVQPACWFNVKGDSIDVTQKCIHGD